MRPKEFSFTLAIVWAVGCSAWLGCAGPRAAGPVVRVDPPGSTQEALIVRHEDPDEIIESAVALHAAGRYDRAAEQFLRAAKLPTRDGSEDLPQRGLLAASIAYLMADQREDFHRVVRDLRAQTPRQELLWPGDQLRLVLFLDAYIRGEAPAEVPLELRPVLKQR